MLTTYLETRAGLHWGNKGEQTACPYCPNKPHHTYTHCIHEGKYSLCTRTSLRDEYRRDLDQQGVMLPKADIETITASVTTDNHQDLHFLVVMIQSSPYL